MLKIGVNKRTVRIGKLSLACLKTERILCRKVFLAVLLNNMSLLFRTNKELRKYATVRIVKRTILLNV